MKSKWTAALVFAAGAAIAPSLADAATPVGHSVLKSLFPGTFAVQVQGVSATFIAGGNGSLRGTSFVGTDTGRWAVRNGKLCIMLREWFDGETRCSAVVRSGSWYRANTVRFRKI